MFVKDNKVESIINLFKTKLHSIYQEREIDNIILLSFEYVMGWDKITFRQNRSSNLSESELLKFNNIVKRLASNEPIQYIIGETEFYGLRFKVDSSVLIPRPETEELVNLIINDHLKNQEISILDIGTGSGCIAVAIKKHLPKAKVFALDVSSQAIDVAMKNASLNQVDVEFIVADILNQKPLNQKFDIIVSNPPYIVQQEKEFMHNNVLKYEPHLALFVEESMQFYSAILEFSKSHLKLGGKIYFELNENFALEYERVFKNYTKNFSLIQDMQNKYRVAKLNF